METVAMLASTRPMVPVIPIYTAPQSKTVANSKLKLQPPQKHVDKSQKQQFVIEFPTDAAMIIGNMAIVNVDRKHFLPPVLLTGIAKQQKEEKSRSGQNAPVQGELSIQIMSRDDKEITFEKCERCQEKDSHIFPLLEKMDNGEENQKLHPRNCFALIGTERVQFDKGKAIIPVYFRCCPTHHTSKKGENFVRMKVRIVGTKGNFVYESDFVKVQWKKGKHNRQAKVTPTTTTTTTCGPSAVPNPMGNLLNAATSPSPVHVPTIMSSSALPPLSPTSGNQCSPSVHSGSSPGSGSPPFPNILLNESPDSTPNPLNMLSLGLPPYQAYMNMFQHLQNYYVRPLEEENKKLRSELDDTTRSVSNLKEENRKLRDVSLTTPRREEYYLDQLRTYQYELECAPNFLSGPDDEFESGGEEDTSSGSDLDPSKWRPNSRKTRTLREAMKFLKFKSSIKLVPLKHNGAHWYEPIDRSRSSSYQNGDRIGIRIVNKNHFPILVRLHRVSYDNHCTFVPLCNDDFLKIEGCREDNDQWETAYFDLGPASIPVDYQKEEGVELLKLLVMSAGPGERMSTTVTRSIVIHR